MITNFTDGIFLIACTVIFGGILLLVLMPEFWFPHGIKRLQKWWACAREAEA